MVPEEAPVAPLHLLNLPRQSHLLHVFYVEGTRVDRDEHFTRHCTRFHGFSIRCPPFRSLAIPFFRFVRGLTGTSLLSFLVPFRFELPQMSFVPVCSRQTLLIGHPRL